MQVIRDPTDAATITDPHIRHLVELRICELGKEPYDLKALGFFLVIEPGDAIESINAQLGFSILCNRATGIRYDEPGYTPSFEFIEEFSGCYDAVFVLGQEFAVEVFIPKVTGVDSDLLQMCAVYATLGTV